jgi:hypothetical protein
VETEMSVEPVELLGGESVYCINQAQLKTAYDLAESDGPSKAKIQEVLAKIQGDFSRNEQAALAFVLIDSLLQTIQE